MKAKLAFYISVVALTALNAAHAQSPPPMELPVTVDNFIRAESDLYMGSMVKDGSFGKFFRRREPAAIDNQTVIRLNRDTLYSSGCSILMRGR